MLEAVCTSASQLGVVVAAHRHEHLGLDARLLHERPPGVSADLGIDVLLQLDENHTVHLEPWGEGPARGASLRRMADN
jgi:hypothetical protein